MSEQPRCVKTRIVLADGHPIVLGALSTLIQAEHDFHLVGSASNGLAAVKLIREMEPDIAILNISMPDLNGIVLTRSLTRELPSVRILVFTMHEDRAHVRQALESGARGYVLKRSAPQRVIQAIRAVAISGLYVDPAVSHHIFGITSRGSKNSDSGAVTSLTEREADTLKLSALGFTNKEIARRSDVGIKSIETYKARGSAKLGVKNRVELVRYASAQGWLDEAI